jgi:hypothetical protein
MMIYLKTLFRFLMNCMGTTVAAVLFQLQPFRLRLLVARSGIIAGPAFLTSKSHFVVH